jgi:hypothetical protein
MMLIRQNTAFRLERALPTSCHGIIPCILSAGRQRRTLRIDAHPRNAMHLRQHQSGTTAMREPPLRALMRQFNQYAYFTETRHAKHAGLTELSVGEALAGHTDGSNHRVKR